MIAQALPQSVSSKSIAVFAATPTPTPTPKTFDETVTLQFFVEKDYSITVKGVIELVNNTGKDISLTQYDMNLPYFTLKKTEIGYVYPAAFLVDMYSENNSILFTFKSMYTKPVVIGKGGKVTFTYTAQVVNAYKEIGPLRTLAFPFTLSDDHRKTQITVILDSSLPLVAAPKTTPELSKKGIYTITETSGKGFVFLEGNGVISVTLSSNQEVALPFLNPPNTCMQETPITCTGCKEINVTTDRQVLAVKQPTATKVSATLAKDFTKDCLQTQFKNFDVISAMNIQKRQKVTGFAIMPDTATLIPAVWEYVTTGSGNYIQMLDTNGIIYAFRSDIFGTLLIPLIACTSDDDCIKASQLLRTFDIALDTNPLQPDRKAYAEAQNSDINLAITQHGSTFSLLLENRTESFLMISEPAISDNPLFALRHPATLIIAPKATISYDLFTKKRIQTSNQPITITFSSKKQSSQVTFSPVRITIITIIETLGYLFVVALGIFLLSISTIILYNRHNAKKDTHQ